MILKYLIDTDTFIYIKNHRPPQVLKHFKSMEVGEVTLSVISYGELFRGCERSHFKHKNHEQLKQLIRLIPVQSLPVSAGVHYGELRTRLEKQGNVIGANDMWIAAHALSMELTLLTNNTKEFSRVDGLKIKNWVK